MQGGKKEKYNNRQSARFTINRFVRVYRRASSRGKERNYSLSDPHKSRESRWRSRFGLCVYTDIDTGIAYILAHGRLDLTREKVHFPARSKRRFRETLSPKHSFFFSSLYCARPSMTDTGAARRAESLCGYWII